MDFSPQELDAVESRADQLYRLKKKYGATVGEMLDYLERSKKELDEIEYADDRIVQLQGTLAKQEREMLAAARTLSRRAQGCGKSARGAHSAGAARAGHEQGPLFHRLYRA